MRNKFVYSCITKIHASGFDDLLESIFWLLLVVEAFSLQEVVKMFEEVVVGWQEARWTWQMRQNFVAQFCSTFEALFVQCMVGCCHGELGPFCWPMPATGVAVFSIINLLSLLLGCNGFAGIQKTSGSDWQQTSMQWPWPFFSASLALRSALELLLGPTTELVITSCHIKSTFRCTIQLRHVSLLLCRIRVEDTSKGWLFFDFPSAHEAPTCWGLLPSQFAANAEWPYSGWRWVLW